MSLESSHSFLQQVQADLARSQAWLQQAQADLTRSQAWLQQIRQSQIARPASSSEAELKLPQPLDPYDAWLRVNQWNDRAFQHLLARLQACQGALPKISVVMPVFNPQVPFLEKAIASVVNQVHPDWELCIADDCSTDPVIRQVLEQWANRDRRIRVTFRAKNGNISAATNSAAELATSDFLLFLDHDDELTPNALGEVALYLVEHPDTDFLYSDDDKIDIEGRRYAPQFKPDWSPELLLSYMYCTHLCVVRRQVFEQVGGIRVGFEGSQDYDFALRATEVARHVGHLPLILYHWRSLPGSTAQSGSEKPASFTAGQRAIQEAFDRRGIPATVIQPEWALQAGCGIFEHQFSDQGGSVAIVLVVQKSVQELKRCLTALRQTTYQNYQVVIVDASSSDPDTLAYLAQVPDRVLRFSSKNPANLAAIQNWAAAQLDSDYLLFLSSEAEVKLPQWLSQLIGYAQFSGVGAVGAKLIDADGTIEQAGIVHNLSDPAFQGLSAQDYGYLSYAKVARNYSAVTAACLLTPRQLFLEVGGFDEQFGDAYADRDYCYRLTQQEWRCVYCPSAVLYRQETTQPPASDWRAALTFRHKYADFVDRFYSPHLALDNPHFAVRARHVFVGSLQRRLRVLMGSLTLDFTGAALIQYEIAVELAAQGLIEPVVFCAKYDGALRREYERHGIQVVVHPDFPLDPIPSFERYEQTLQALSQELTALDVDVMYINTIETFFLVDCARRMGIPCIWNIHESEPWQTRFDRFGADIAARALACFQVPYQVVFGSHATRELYTPLNTHHNATTVHNWLHRQKLQAEATRWSRETARLSLAIAGDEIVILLLGTICDRKGQHDLPLALASLPQQWHDRVKVLIVGDRELPYSAELKQIIDRLPETLKSRVQVVAETQDAAYYYSAADILVFTSRIECFPRVILEGMAYGLPLITTPVFGVKEQAQPGVNALFYTPGQPEELATALLTLLQDQALRSRLSQNSRFLFSGMNRFEAMVQRYATLLQESYFSQNFGTSPHQFKLAEAKPSVQNSLLQSSLK